MFLDAVSQVREVDFPTIVDTVRDETREVFDAWKDWVPSRVSHHGRICCEIAREWLVATDFSVLNGGNRLTGPRWIRNRFKWGPSSYPIYWCEAVTRERLDCGALAALAHEVFTARGIGSFRAQFVQRFSSIATSQWSCNWTEKGVPVSWIADDLVYHEGCAVEVREGEIKVWDASAGWWIDPQIGRGYGSLLAIRIGAGEPGTGFEWGKLTIQPNAWQTL